MFIGIGGVWLAWLAGWINRVELRQRAAPQVAALGLRFDGEGMRWRVSASGTLGGVPVQLRWTTGALGPAVWWRVGQGRWEEAEDGPELPARLRERVKAG